MLYMSSHNGAVQDSALRLSGFVEQQRRTFRVPFPSLFTYYFHLPDLMSPFTIGFCLLEKSEKNPEQEVFFNHKENLLLQHYFFILC